MLGKPLSGLRLVVTLPPFEFFGGVDRRRADDQAAALRELGACVLEFETQAVYRRDQKNLQAQVEKIKTFAPDAVIGAQHSGYAIQGGMINEVGSEPKNLFLDVLELPTILYWDHVLTQAASYLIPSWPDYPEKSESGVLDHLRGLMMHPRATHFFPDTGHVAELKKLGIATFDYDPFFVTAVAQTFLKHGEGDHNRSTPTEKVAFFGNLYLAASDKIPYRFDPVVKNVRRVAFAACESNWNLAVYDAYAAAIDSLQDDERMAMKFDVDQSFYWRFLHDELAIYANGQHRFRVLASAQHPVAFYGGFADPETRAEVLRRDWPLRESLPHDQSLAEAYRNTEVTVDVVNAPFIRGFSPKLLECFAAGGFMLTTRKADMARAFGGLGDAIGYSTADELSAKIDFYLGHERERSRISRELRDIIRRDHSAVALFARTLPQALERVG